MAEPRRRLLDAVLDGDTLLGGILTDVRKSARKRFLGRLLQAVVSPRVDALLGPLRR